MDFLINLYDMGKKDVSDRLAKNGVVIVRAMSPDKHKVLAFMREYYSEGWASETDHGFSNNPISTYIAVKDGEIIGVSSFDATAKGYFGPIGVKPQLKGMGVGQGLLYATLDGMKENGYGYAIVGWMEAHAIGFYERCVKGFRIPDSDAEKTIYHNLAALATKE